MNKRQSPGFVYTVCASPDGSQRRYITGRSHGELKHPGREDSPATTVTSTDQVCPHQALAVVLASTRPRAA